MNAQIQGGHAVAKFCSERLPGIIASRKELSDPDQCDWNEALTHAFIQMDQLVDSEEGRKEIRRIQEEGNPQQAEQEDFMEMVSQTCIFTNDFKPSLSSDSKIIIGHRLSAEIMAGPDARHPNVGRR